MISELRLVLGEDTAKVESSVGACLKYPTEPSTPIYIHTGPRHRALSIGGTLSSAARPKNVSEISKNNSLVKDLFTGLHRRKGSRTTNPYSSEEQQTTANNHERDATLGSERHRPSWFDSTGSGTHSTHTSRANL